VVADSGGPDAVGDAAQNVPKNASAQPVSI
jgi:hypothetical protein